VLLGGESLLGLKDKGYAGHTCLGARCNYWVCGSGG